MQLPWVAEAFVSCAAGSFVGRRPKTRSAGHYKDLTKRETAHEKPLAPRVRGSEQNSRFKNADQMIFFLLIVHQVRQVAMKAVLSQQAYLLFYTRVSTSNETSKVSRFFSSVKL